MAANTKPTSLWVASYSDKTDSWVQARLEHLEDKERLSQAGSVSRRKEIRELRVEVRNRKAAAAAAATTAAPAPLPAAATPPRPHPTLTPT